MTASTVGRPVGFSVGSAVGADGVSGVALNGLLDVSTGDLNTAGTIVLSFFPDPTGIVTVDPATPEQGGSATFTYVADTFTYQWMLDGSNITDETGSTLTLTGADHTNNGSYTVSVTNDRTGKTKIFGPLVVEIEEPEGIPVTSGLYTHLDATVAGSVLNSVGPDVAATDTQTIRRILDQSGNSRHWNQSTELDKPTYIASGINSLPIARFNSSLLSGPLPEVGSDTISVFLVYTTADTEWVFFGENSGTTAEYPIRSQSGSTNTFWRAGVGATANYVDGVLQSWTNRGTVYTALNGLHCLIITDWSLTSWTRGADALFFGGYYNKSSAFAGDLAELAIYEGSLDAGQIASLVSYAQTKYGTP